MRQRSDHPCDRSPVPAADEAVDLPDLQVVVTTVGNNISMCEIDHASGAGQGLTAGKPFAGNLELRMDMSRTNLIVAGITHYRWSYQRLSKGDGTPLPATKEWQPMAQPVFRHYKKMVPDPANPGKQKPVYPAEPMGPDEETFPGLSLFKIQPLSPPDASAIEWSPQINEHIDSAWAYFNTGALTEPDPANPSKFIPAAGKYALKFELFKSDGTLVNWSHPNGPTSSEIQLFVSANQAPFVPPVGMTTVAAGTHNQILDSNLDVIGYQMVLHVDNNKCEANIIETWVDEATNKAGSCGFIHFEDRTTSSAHLSFTARHRNNFAQLKFEVVKGSSGHFLDACAGVSPEWADVGTSSINDFSRDSSSTFTKSVPVSTLLDANDVTCKEAAFAETLHVKAIAVDGYNARAEWLDARATPKAFALAPQPKPLSVISTVMPED